MAVIPPPHPRPQKKERKKKTKRDQRSQARDKWSEIDCTARSDGLTDNRQKAIDQPPCPPPPSFRSRHFATTPQNQVAPPKKRANDAGE